MESQARGHWRRSGLWTTILILCGSRDVVAQRAPAITLRQPNAVFDVPDEQFTAITSIRELSDGRVLVADRGENRVALVDFASSKSLPVGRTGDGPGEFRGVGWLFPLAGDSTLLTDSRARRWLILDGTRIVETIPGDQPLVQELGSLLAGTDDRGHVLGVVSIVHSTAMPPRRENADSLAVILASRSGPGPDTLVHIRGRGPNALCVTVRGEATRGPVNTCSLITTEDLPLLMVDGWVAVAMADPYRVDWRDPEGRWIRGPPLPYDPIPIDGRDRCRFLGHGLASSCDDRAYEWPMTMPPFMTFMSRGAVAPFSPAALAAPDGALLIRRATTPSRSSSQYDLVNRRGVLIGTLSLPQNEAVVGFGQGSIYVVEVTDLGLQQLRRHAWP